MMAGFFGFFDYTKPGPGVPKDAPRKKGIALFFELFFRKFWKLITVSLLYFVCCIPVFTIGPATAGLTYVLRNFAREEHAWVASDFREHAMKNFKQSIIVWLINFVAYALMAISFWFYMFVTSPVLQSFRYVLLVAAGIFTIMHFYMYPMMVTFQLKVSQIYKNSFIFAMVKLPQNLVILLVCGGIYFALLWNLDILGFFLIPFLLAPVGFIVNFYAYSVIKKYMLDKMEDNPENVSAGSNQSMLMEDHTDTGTGGKC